MKSHSSDDRDYILWVLLCQARDAVFKARNKELSQFDISAVQAAVLFVIKTIEEEATPTGISRWLLRQPHTISTLLTRMEKEGLVTKAKNLGKKREIKITLTEKGEQAYGQSLKRESIREVMSYLSEEERQQLSSSLEKIRDKALNNSTTVKKCRSHSIATMRSTLCIY